jgi:hypothetical protein
MSERPEVPVGRPPAAAAGPSERERASKDYRLAWLALLLFPFSLAGAFLVGNGLATVLGVPTDGSAVPPVWAALAVGVPAVLVFAIPAAVATLLCRRAARLGRPSAWGPAIVAAVLVVVFCGQNLLAYLAQVLLD